jgi:hypothetical protein
VALTTSDTRLQTQVLHGLSQGHRYRRWLADLARPHLGAHPIEIGAGTGDYALEWVGSSGVMSFTATEADDHRCAHLAYRFRGHPVVRTRQLRLGGAADSDVAQAHSSALAFNVLEHIDDDVAALASMRSLVAPGGTVVLIVPAFESAMSDFDVAVGHFRRYSRASLSQALGSAGLRPVEIRYVNPMGLIAWYVAVKAMGLEPGDGWLTRLYDRMVVPIARATDRTNMPFGQSVFAVARV